MRGALHASTNFGPQGQEGQIDYAVCVFVGLDWSGQSRAAAVVWMSAIVAPASTPPISASRGFTPSRRSEAGCPEFSRMADAVSLHLLVTSSVQAFSETRSAYYALR